MVVEVEPVVQRSYPLGFRMVGPDVGPLLEHGAVEPFDLAVGLWPVRLGAAVLDVAEGFGEEVAAVTASIVGEDLGDRDVVLGEPGSGSQPMWN